MCIITHKTKYERSPSLLDSDTLVKVAGISQLYGPISEMMQSCKWFQHGSKMPTTTNNDYMRCKTVLKIQDSRFFILINQCITMVQR